MLSLTESSARYTVVLINCWCGLHISCWSYQTKRQGRPWISVCLDVTVSKPLYVSHGCGSTTPRTPAKMCFAIVTYVLPFSHHSFGWFRAFLKSFRGCLLHLLCRGCPPRGRITSGLGAGSWDGGWWSQATKCHGFDKSKRTDKDLLKDVLGNMEHWVLHPMFGCSCKLFGTVWLSLIESLNAMSICNMMYSYLHFFQWLRLCRSVAHYMQACSKPWRTIGV